MKTIDNGFTLVSQKFAKQYGIPKYGWEKLIQYQGQHYWLTRTPYNGKMHLAIRTTRWKLVNGQATL